MIPADVAVLPWIQINFGSDASTIFMALFNALSDSIAKRSAERQMEVSDAMGVILIAPGALVAGAALGRGRPSS